MLDFVDKNMRLSRQEHLNNYYNCISHGQKLSRDMEDTKRHKSIFLDVKTTMRMMKKCTG